MTDDIRSPFNTPMRLTMCATEKPMAISILSISNKKKARHYNSVQSTDGLCS